MYVIIGILILVVCLSSFFFRSIILHPFASVRWAFVDVFRFFTKYRWIPKNPFINVYVGLFGMGKTLSAVHDVIAFYKTYNNRMVYDDRVGKMVTQKVFILSNVDLKGVPYRRFHSLQQLQNIAKWRHITDKKHNVRTVTIVLGDEFSVQLNSRAFKTFPVPFIKTLLTSRHALIHGFFLTSQRFGHMDALLRQVSSNVIECRKYWRFVRNVYYDAWSYENCSRLSDLAPKGEKSFFASDAVFGSYDTLAVVDELNKIIDDGSFLSEKEILDNRGSQPIRISNAPEGRKRRKAR